MTFPKLTTQISTTLAAALIVCGVVNLLGSGNILIQTATAQENLDKAAIPRPGLERRLREEAALEERRIARQAAIAAAIAEAEGTPKITEPEAEAEEDEGTASADGSMPGMEGAIPPELAELLPIGAEFEGVRFPNYTGDQLTSIVNAEKMARLDSEHLDLTDLVIDVLNDLGVIETKIYMDRAVYDLTERKLVSRSEATIDQKPKFVMTGDKLVFEGETQKGRMTGNVKMTIFNMKQAGGGILGAPKGNDDSGDNTP